LFFGSFAAEPSAYEYRISSLPSCIISLDAAAALFILFLSTSFLGILLIPTSVLFFGYLTSVFISSAYLFHPTASLFFAAVTEVLPTLLFLPAFFIISDLCLCASGRMFELRHGINLCCRTKGLAFPILPAILFVFLLKYFYIIYLIPTVGF